jgi:class 3 adenylate cyclase
VLFADLKGSMELLANRDPEEARKILDPVLERMMEAVHRDEGTVNQVVGDGIMALFGAPVAHEDHAVRACYAALTMQDSVKRYAEAIQRAAGVPIQIRVGLNSGEVVVRSIGSDLHMDYTAVGQTTHLAARMEQMAMAGSVLLTADALRLAEGFVEVKLLGPVNVKGLREPVEVFNLEAVGSFRTRFDRSRARGLSEFVGRDREMAALDAALERARSGSGQVVGVVAEAGSGKSRLCAEFVESCRARGIPILEGHGVAHGKAIPMLPMLEMWRAFYEIGDGDGPETARARIAGRLLQMDESFREVLPFVFDLFGVPDPANPSPAIDPEQRQKRIHGVLKRILRDPAYGGLRVILLEDLHWFDGASDAYLETTVESMAATHDLLLLTSVPSTRRAGYSARTTGGCRSSRSIPRRSARSCASNSGRIRASRRCPRSSTRAPRAIHSSSRRWCSRWRRAVSWREGGAPTGWRRRWKCCRCRPAFMPSCRRASISCRSARSRCCRPPR